MNGKLLEIVEYNKDVQRKARDLNIRAGEDIFLIMSYREWEIWLKSRLGGARRVSEVIDFEKIRLPELDPELVGLVIEENPDVVEIEGVTLTIEYGKDYYGGVFCRTSVEEEFARKCSSEAILLTIGRTVEICCSGHSAKSFKELVEKLEKSRIDRCWSTARSQHETSWTSDSQKVISWLDKVGSQVEITRTENGNGVPIYGFVGLKQYSGYFEWQLFLADTKEKTDEETQKSLEALVKSAVKEALRVPQEEPWQKQSSGWYAANWLLTDLGNALQSRYETLVREHAEGMTSSNVWTKIEALKAAMERAKLEIGGEHERTKKIIEETKSSLERNIDSLEDKGFVSSEIEEVRKLIREAEDALIGGSYGDAKAKCEKVEAVWKQAQDRISQRQALVEKGEILINFEAWHRRGGMSNNGDGWVIRPDGLLRNRDSDDVCRYKSDGNYRWNYVAEDELALKWSCQTMGDIVGSSEFIVAKMPVKGLTEAQREAVKRIETEDIGTVENSFNLNSEETKRELSLMAEIKKIFKNCPACGEEILYEEDSYRKISGGYGLHFCSGHGVSRLVRNKPFDQKTEERSAQVVISKKLSSGVLEILAYEKWGDWNLNMRWREEVEMVEIFVSPKPTEVVKSTESAEKRSLEDSLAALKRQWGSK